MEAETRWKHLIEKSKHTFIILFYNKYNTRFTSKSKLCTVKILKSKVIAHGGIMREERSSRPEKLSKVHLNYILKL